MCVASVGNPPHSYGGGCQLFPTCATVHRSTRLHSPGRSEAGALPAVYGELDGVLFAPLLRFPL
jgi:hypothetical protein